MIVVTGGGTGIGRATAEAFRAQGEEVVITGRRRQVLEEVARETGARAVVCDGSRPEQLTTLVTALDGAPITCLVNNAGGNTDIGRRTESLEHLREAWLDNFAANVLTAVLTTAALTDLLEDGGSVVNVGSIAAETGAGSYGTAKAAIQSWTVELAAELGRRGIRANAVAPGFIEETEFFRGSMTPERRAALRDATATGAVGTPRDVAQMVLFLASAQSAHLTGQTLHLNGGAHNTR